MAQVYYETINPFGIHIIQRKPGKNVIVTKFLGKETTLSIKIPKDDSIPVKKGNVIAFEEQGSPHIKVLQTF